MSLKVTTAPASEPLSLAEIKLPLRVSHDSEDAYITSLLKAARQSVEVETSRVLVTQTIVETFDAFPGGGKALKLSRPPVQSITSIVYVASDGTETTWDSDEWQAVYGEPATIRPAYGYSWPSTRCEPEAVRVTYLAGYGDATAVPELAKAAIRLIVGHWYENREAVVTGAIATELPRSVDHIIGLLSWGHYL